MSDDDLSELFSGETNGFCTTNSNVTPTSDITLESMLAAMQAMQDATDAHHKQQAELLAQLQACPICWETPHYNHNRALVLCETWYGRLRRAFPPKPESVHPANYLGDTLGGLPLTVVACVPQSLRFDFAMQAIERDRMRRAYPDKPISFPQP